MTTQLLIVKELCTSFYLFEGQARVLDGVSFEIQKGETFGLVGETGCGKTVTAMSLLGLISEPGRIDSGEVLFKGENLLQKTEEELNQLRGKEISMIFQDPAASLNPLFTVGEQVIRIIMRHQGLDQKEAQQETKRLFECVQLPDAQNMLDRYPFELSAGMQQRIMISMALSSNSDLLIADEPTATLDVTIQDQILELLLDLKKDLGLSILLITHNLGIVAEICDRVGVLYAGVLVEGGPKEAIFENPTHPYTRGLLAALPEPGRSKKKLHAIRGSIPNFLDPPPGCRFHPRCDFAMGLCRRQKPPVYEIDPDHEVSCYLYDKQRV